MKVYKGYFKAYEYIKVPDDTPIEQVRTALANHLGYYYFAPVRPQDVEGIEEDKEYDQNNEFLVTYYDE